MTIFAVSLILMSIHPFGDRQVLVVDLWHQYFPFISDLWHGLREGRSMMWSWTAGAGHDYLGHIGYYLASPFNFLAALFPHAWLREVLTVFLMFKIGLAGFFMSLYLRYISPKRSIMIPAFAAVYALCAFVFAYYWNFMWMDTFAMLPLVAFGVHKLVAEGKYRLFVISLALSIIFNFYIGFFICIFAAMYFFVLGIKYKLNLREFLRRLLTISICSIVALGLTAFLSLPTLEVLQHTGRGDTTFPSFSFYRSFVDVLGNFASFSPTRGTPGSVMEHGPANIYAGLLVILLYPVFLISKIPLREKIAFSAMAAFMLISTNINVLNFIWHGFSFTHGLPFRYSFLISFVMIIMAYRAFSLGITTKITKWHLLAMGGGAAVFIALSHFGSHPSHALLAIILSTLYISIFALMAVFKDKAKVFTTAKIALCVVVVAELATASFMGITQQSYTTSRTDYPWSYEDVQSVLAHRQTPEHDFVRTDFTQRWSTNDPALYGITGISMFSSFANQNTLRFMGGLGLINWSGGNSYAFAETSPLTAAFLNIRYLVDRLNTPADDGVFWHRVANYGFVNLMQNSRHLPLGFMVNPAMEHYIGDMHNPFNSQNDLFRRATGLDGDLFTLLPVVHVGHENLHVTSWDGFEWNFNMDEGHTSGIFRFNYSIPHDAEVYAYIRITNTNDIHLTIGYDERHLRNIPSRYSDTHMFRVGSFVQGDMITFRSDTTQTWGNASTFVGVLNRELFEEGFAILASQPWQLTSFADTRIKGSITVLQDGILYTSIPYNGFWRAFVNGERVEVFAIDGAMSAIWLEEGEHFVEFRYHNTAFIAGVTISLVSLMIFLAPIVIEFLHKKGVIPYGKKPKAEQHTDNA